MRTGGHHGLFKGVLKEGHGNREATAGRGICGAPVVGG
jgi:hypothetical protein